MIINALLEKEKNVEVSFKQGKRSCNDNNY